jgi:hypothetical protein
MPRLEAVPWPGFGGTGGPRRDDDGAAGAPAAGARVAIQVGNVKDGSSFPANLDWKRTIRRSPRCDVLLPDN